MVLHRFRLIGLLLGFAALLTLAAAPLHAATARARHGATGKIRGTVSGSAALGRMQFYVDGVRVRPQLQKSRFQLSGVPVGQHELRISYRDGSRGAHVPATVQARSVTDVGAVQLETGGQITGTVSQVDPATGSLTPLAGVEVLAQSNWYPPPCVGVGGVGQAGGGTATGKSIVCPLPGGPGMPVIDPLPPLHATTDANGAYVFTDVSPGSWRVSVVDPGLEAGVEFVDVQAGETSTADFQLRPTIPDGVGTVNGTVTGPNGAAVEGAQVTIYTQGVFYPPVVAAESVEHARLKGHAADALTIAIPRGSFSTLTDAQGHYSLNVPSGYLTLDVYADGLQPAELSLTVQPESTQTANVQLDAIPTPDTGSIVGTVTDAATGKPLAGARVTVLIMLPMARGGKMATPIHLPPPPFQAFTDADGQYEIDGIPAGKVPVQAWLSGYQAGSVNVVVTGGDTATADFKLTAGGDKTASPGKK